MPGFELRLFTDELEPGAKSPQLPAMRRALYVAEGEVAVDTDGQRRSLSANQALFSADATVVAAEKAARVLRWELVGIPAEEPVLATAGGVRSVLTLSHFVALHPWTDYLLRCDRVDFPPGGQALTHIHPGPGIRCLVQGNIEIRSEGRSTRYHAGEAWFELGPEPVFAQASEEAATSFVRVSILPRALEGTNSIDYVDPADRDRPKSQRYQRFFDVPLSLS